MTFDIAKAWFMKGKRPSSPVNHVTLFTNYADHYGTANLDRIGHLKSRGI